MALAMATCLRCPEKERWDKLQVVVQTNTVNDLLKERTFNNVLGMCALAKREKQIGFNVEVVER